MGAGGDGCYNRPMPKAKTSAPAQSGSTETGPGHSGPGQTKARPKTEANPRTEAGSRTKAGAKETGGPEGPDPTRYGDWERKGICVDF